MCKSFIKPLGREAAKQRQPFQKIARARESSDFSLRGSEAYTTKTVSVASSAEGDDV